MPGHVPSCRVDYLVPFSAADCWGFQEMSLRQSLLKRSVTEPPSPKKPGKDEGVYVCVCVCNPTLFCAVCGGVCS